MRRTHKRFGSLLLVLAMLLTLLPVSAMAADTTVTSFGSLKDAVRSADSGDTITISDTIELDGDLEIPEGKELTLKGESDAAKLATSGQNTILVKGNLTIQNLRIGGLMDAGYAPITVAADNAQLYSDRMVLENTCTSGSDGFATAAQGIQVASTKATFNSAPSNVTIHLKNSTVALNAASARGISFGQGNTKDNKLILDNTVVRNGVNWQNEWMGGYSRGLNLPGNTVSSVEILNDSKIYGWQYAVNTTSTGDMDGADITVDHSSLLGWSGFNIWTDNGSITIQNQSTVIGTNGQYNTDKKYSFSVIVINGDIYNSGNPDATGNRLVIADSTIAADTIGNVTPVETLIRIDRDDNSVKFYGTVTFTDSTGGSAGAVFDIGNMDDPIAFIERHVDLTDGVVVNTPNGNPVWPSYEVYYYWEGGGVLAALQDVLTSSNGLNLTPGEGIELRQNATLTNDVEVKMAGGVGPFTLKLGEYTVSGGKIILADGMSVICDRQADDLFDAAARIGSTYYASFDDAVDAAQNGDTILLLKDVESSVAVTIPAGVTLDGNGKTLAYTGGSVGAPSDGAFVNAGGGNVIVKNLIVETNDQIKHGVQFYCCSGGKLSGVTVRGGTYTSVMINGANVTLENCDLHPAASAYANIEYAMGGGVTEIPEITLSNVTGNSGKPLVYADKATAIALNAEDDHISEDAT